MLSGHTVVERRAPTKGCYSIKLFCAHMIDIVTVSSPIVWRVNRSDVDLRNDCCTPNVMSLLTQ